MRKLLTLAFLLLLSVEARAQTASLTVRANGPPALVLGMPMDDGSGTTVRDISGFGNTGSFVGTGNSWVAGGLQMSGGGSVQVPDNDSLDLSIFTISVTLNPSSLAAAFRTVVNMSLVAPGSTYFLFSSATNCGASSIAGGFVGEDGVTYYRVCDPTPLVSNGTTFTHLALTYDGTDLKLYKNATLLQTLTVTQYPLESAGPLQIGNNQFGATFRGIMRDLAIYNYALPLNNGIGDACGDTAPSITQRMNCPLVPTAPITPALAFGPDANVTFGADANVTFGSIAIQK